MGLLAACSSHDGPRPAPKANVVRFHTLPDGGAYTTVSPASPCPDWSAASERNFGNRDMSNLGCASTNNLAKMVEDPRDLLHGSPGAPSDAVRHGTVMQAYREGKAPAIVNSTGSASE